MQMIRRKIKLFFVSYGRFFTFFIGIFLGAILVARTLNSIAVKTNGNFLNETYEEKVAKHEEIEKDIAYISQFIDYCNNGEIEEAYSMLSNNCKKERYDTIDKFKQQYINKVFKINISEYSFVKKGNTYIVTLKQDMLITGKLNSTINTEIKIDAVLERKIYICD